MEFMNQPFNGQLGNRLIELLDSRQYHTLNIAVAFAKNSGVLRLKNSFERFRSRGGKINVYVGIDLFGTSYEALTTLLIHTDSLNIVHSEKIQTFHSKIYQFIGENNALIVVGSHNLTGGGLWTNFESSVIIPTNISSLDNIQMNGYFNGLSSLNESFLPINTQEDIDRLLHNGYVLKEVSEQMHRIKRIKITAQNETRERIFGNGTPAALPRISTQENNNTVAISEVQISYDSTSLDNNEWQIIWFETRKMTGGSRNILDLSKTSFVERGDYRGTSFDYGNPRLMRGAVEFFGLDPTDISRTKDITLNFEGVDYTNNTILFPSGERANGTWRLQIKGSDSSERKITDAFRSIEEDFLVEKIITFTKVQGDYYFMSVFPESELNRFKDTSRILARNGSTRSAKQLGLF